MTEKFESAFSYTMFHEGLYSNDSDDYGKETYLGISRVHNRNWPGWLIIDWCKLQSDFNKALEEKEDELYSLAKTHYYYNFYIIVGGDKLDEELALEMFDNAVNFGTKRSVIFLQQALNSLNRNGKLFNDLKEDGVFGKNTMDALRVIEKLHEISLVIKIINVLQGYYYINRTREDSTQEKFIRGWFNRVTIIKEAKDARK